MSSKSMMLRKAGEQGLKDAVSFHKIIMVLYP